MIAKNGEEMTSVLFRAPVSVLEKFDALADKRYLSRSDLLRETMISVVKEAEDDS